jgi:uncharacterized protein (TIGR02265 family)
VPLDRHDLDARLRLAGPAHHVKGSLFRSVCAELAKLPDELPGRDALIARHQKAAWQEFSSFPVGDYLELVFASAALLEPGLGGFGPALTELGARVSDAFLRSVVGRLAVMMASGKSPLDVLSYAPAAYAPTANYGKRTFERVGPHEAVLHVREDFLPPSYHLGVVRSGVSINGHHPEVELRPLGLLDCDVVVRWSEEMDRKAG